MACCCCLSTRSSIWPIDVHQIYCSKDLAAGKTEFASRELIDWQKRKMINREIQAASDWLKSSESKDFQYSHPKTNLPNRIMLMGAILQ
jgi:hypothetical protein